MDLANVIAQREAEIKRPQDDLEEVRRLVCRCFLWLVRLLLDFIDDDVTLVMMRMMTTMLDCAVVLTTDELLVE